jgi:GGDEF domain-containing protein
VETIPIPIQGLLPLVNQRFASFADAADTTLSALVNAVPGTILLGELEPEDAKCRVIDVRGNPLADVGPGALLPLAVAGEPSPVADQQVTQRLQFDAGLDRDFLQGLSIASELSVPLEMRNGNLAAVIYALAEDGGAYRAEHVLLLGLAARLLSHEWESVHSRAEIRRLRQRLRDDASIDSATGLPTRESFLDLLAREWQLTQRGTVQSMVVVCKVEAIGNGSQAGPAAAELALKDAAEILAGSIRSTDHAGRIGEMSLGAVMVGCPDLAGANAFTRRYESALARATGHRAARMAVSCASHPLADASSAAEALELAEHAVLEHGVEGDDDRTPLKAGEQT